MEVNQAQLDEFYSLRNEAASLLSKQTLKDNPNVTYGSLLSPKELELATHTYSPEIAARAKLIYEPEELERISTAINWKQRVAPYNRAPVEYDIPERHPEYQTQLNIYEDYLTGDIDKLKEQYQNSPSLMESDARQGVRRPPATPIGLEKSQEIAALGFDPSNELTFEDASIGRSFRTKVGLGPRKMTTKDYEFLGKEHGLDGEFRYVNPSDPSLGVAFRAKGEDDFQLVNTPAVTGEDFYNFLIQEAPAIAGDIALTVYGGKTMSTALGMKGGLLNKAFKVVGMSGLSALGAAGGDFLRLTAGHAMGAHDRSFEEILIESGVIGAWAFAGTAAISLSAVAIKKAWKAITKTDVPPEFLERIDDALQQARNSEKGIDTPGVLYGDEISVKEIRSQIQRLADKFGEDFGSRKYNPSLPSQAGTTDAADLEVLFLKYADDPELRQLYSEIKTGNQEVIDEFVRTLNDKIGPDITGDATGATVSEGLRVMAQRDIDLLSDQTYDMIDIVRRQVGGAGDSGAAGNALLKQVDNPQASSGPIFERQQTRVAELRKNYVAPYNKAWDDALNNPEYANLKTGAGYTRTATDKWLNQRKGNASGLFRAANADESVRALYDMIPAGPQNTLNRLRGRGKKGFESPDFTIGELNNARVAINDFASNLPEGKQGALKLARELERGLENQMNQLVREGASKKFGIPMTQKVKLNKKIQETGYGDDLRQAWSAQKEALELSNSQAVRSILQQRPEKVAEYLFNTTAKGSKRNTPVTELMTLLKREGSDEIKGIQEGLAAYIQREILQAPDLKPLQIAKNYRKFVKENEGTLRAAFGDEQFATRFMSPKTFQKNVIGGLEKLENKIGSIEARFGMAKTGDVDKRMTNIVEAILSTGRTQKQSGRILEDVEYLRSIVKDNPELEEQVAQVTKRFLLQDIIKPRQGTGAAYVLDDRALNRLLTEGFGPEDIAGPRLNFDNFMIPLLGKDGKEFVKNLKVLNDMVQREMGALPSAGVARDLKGGDYVTGNNIEGARFLQRLLIAPLTQTGRRITALSSRQAENSRKIIGRMLMDEKLFTKVMDMARGRENTQRFIRFLTSYGMVAAQDLGSEMEFYDTTEKKLSRPTTESRKEALDKKRQDETERVLDVFNEMFYNEGVQ